MLHRGYTLFAVVSKAANVNINQYKPFNAHRTFSIR